MSCDVSQWLCYVEPDIIKQFAAFCRHFVCFILTSKREKARFYSKMT